MVISGRLVHARPTVRLRRWIAAICLGLIVLLAAAVAVVRVQFEGEDLAENLCAVMNERMRGRIEIRSIEWPMSSMPKVVSGGWMPVTLRDVQVWDAEGETVARTDRTAYFGPGLGLLATPVVPRSVLRGGALQGPLIVEEYDSTVVIPPGDPVPPVAMPAFEAARDRALANLESTQQRPL